METVEIEKQKTLTAHDRCDRCNAQAFYQTTGISGSLLWCIHHFNKNKEHLEQWAYKIIDESWAINEKSESSA